MHDVTYGDRVNELHERKFILTNVRTFIDALTALENIKTWSFIVTVFGDLDSDNQLPLSGKDIGSIMAHIGIKPEAVRVALHRLKRDGWINTEKSGREVLYFLSRRGLAETACVYEDVYSHTVKYPQGWQLVFEEGEPAFCGIRLSRNLGILPKDRVIEFKDAVMLEFVDQNLPKWLEHLIVAPPTLEIARRLETLLNGYQAMTKPSASLDLIAIRLLFLHHWRKLALRNAVWAHIGLFENGPLSSCHKRITSLLADTPKLASLLTSR
ncbi:MAG: hypothetical protein CML56_02075 [Rhodobacteraceae bacterium]|nr:hypothetical protein [Paracoccaceae bacterium]